MQKSRIEQYFSSYSDLIFNVFICRTGYCCGIRKFCVSAISLFFLVLAKIHGKIYTDFTVFSHCFHKKEES